MYRVLMLSLIALLSSGCTQFRHRKTRLRFLGDSEDVKGLPAPRGFNITPEEATQIMWDHGHAKKTIDHYYVDDSIYYICDGFNNKSTPQSALKSAKRVHGITGEFFDEESGQWISEPKKLELEDESERIPDSVRAALINNFRRIEKSMTRDDAIDILGLSEYMQNTGFCFFMSSGGGTSVHKLGKGYGLEYHFSPSSRIAPYFLLITPENPDGMKAEVSEEKT